MSTRLTAPKGAVPGSRPPQAADLRRSILETTIGAQGRAEVARGELNRQGEVLNKSLAGTKRAVKQTDVTRQQVEQLVGELNESRFKQLIRCCCRCFCCCRCCLCLCLCLCCCCSLNKASSSPEGNQRPEQGAGLPPADKRQNVQSSSGAIDDWNQDDEDQDKTRVSLERLRRIVADGNRKQTDKQSKARVASGRSWKRTLAPSVEQLIQCQSVDVWHQQMDASLNQFQQVSEEIGESLDEQTKLAELLNIYLDYGAEKVHGINSLVKIRL